MAVIAVDNYGAELAKSNAALNTAGTVTQLKPNEWSGRIRVARFSYYPTVAVAANKVIALIRLPFRARILQGKLESNGTVATSTLAIGISAADGSGLPDPNNVNGAGTGDLANCFATALAINTAGEYFFAHTHALNYGYEVQVDSFITAKLGTAGIAGTGDGISGHILYVVD